MIGIFWLLLACLAGWRWSRWLIGEPKAFLARLAGAKTFSAFSSSPWPILFFQTAAAIWIGILPLTWLTYLLAAALAPVLPLSIHPLLIANSLIMPAAGIWLIWPPLGRLLKPFPKKSGRVDFASLHAAEAFKPSKPSVWPALARSLQLPATRFFLIALLIWIAAAVWLMTGTFWRSGSYYHAGYSVFSDFAPHTALISSFSQGRNWPTEYPHFANDGIAYHFIFFFLCGNLNYLGLPLDWAINLPSILGFVAFCILLGTLAMRLTGRRLAYLLTPAMLFLRSSMAFFTYLADLIRQFGAKISSWPAIFAAMMNQSSFIGNTPNDSWGLWCINVYANQRHLLPGLSIALIVLMLFLPDLQRGLELQPKWRQLLFSRNFWLIRGSEARKRLIAAACLCLLLPYFHGSVLVALLLILGGISIFSGNRLSYLIVAASSVLSALLQSKFFSGQATRVVAPSVQIGFIAPDHSFIGILSYLLEMSGLVLPLCLLAFFLPGRRRKVLLASFLLPLAFALTFSLTPDVTVNHKYIMISFAFINIYLADLLGRLWSNTRRAGHLPDESSAKGRRFAKFHLPLLGRRLAALLLSAVLMVTGLQEIAIAQNINQNSLAIDTDSLLVKWIVQNTRPDAVFVSAPLHYNAFYLSGRFTWLGHAYYAYSAGHDTAGREKQEQWLLRGCDHDLIALGKLIATAGLDYLLLDDTLRKHPDFSVDETYFDRHFPVVASFPTLGNLKIYNLRQIIG